MTAENARDLDGVELADAVGSIRNQLVEAAAKATGRTHEVAFTLSPRTAVTGEAWAIGTEDDGSTAGFGGGGGGGPPVSVPSVRLNSPPTARWPSSAPARAAASSSPTARVLLRGEAGAGKTTLLWRLAAHTSARTPDEDLAPPNGLVPLCRTAARPAARGGGFPGPAELSGAAGPATPRAST